MKKSKLLVSLLVICMIFTSVLGGKDVQIAHAASNSVTVYYASAWTKTYVYYRVSGSTSWTKKTMSSTSSTPGYNCKYKISLGSKSKAYVYFTNGSKKSDGSTSDYYTVRTGNYYVKDDEVSDTPSTSATQEPTKAPTKVPTTAPTKTPTTVPTQSVVGDTIVVYYKTTAWSTVYAHYKVNGAWTKSPGVAMEKVSTGYWKISINFGNASEVKICFNNGQGTWDNNNKNNYTLLSTGIYEIDQATKNVTKKGDETPTMVPTATPTVVPATPTPAPATPLPEHCGTESELANWDYTKIEEKKGNTIVLNSYNGSITNITVHAKYCINGTIYNTDFRSTSNYTSGGANDSSGFPTFYDNPGLETVTIDGEIDATSGVWLFGKCSHLRSVKGLSNIHTKDCSYMFKECKALFYIDGIPTGADTCTEMFMYTDFSLSGLNITIPNTVTECERMFSASNISKISGYIGSNVNNAKSMFMNCYNLTDSSGFEVHAKDCSFMFYRCLKMRTRPILGSEITKDESMFDQCA